MLSPCRHAKSSPTASSTPAWELGDGPLLLLAVPHPLQIRRTLRRSPKHVLRSFHWFLFQLPWLPEVLCRAGSRCWRSPAR